MKFNISRRFANIIHAILDGWIPPVIRDSNWFNYIPFKLLYRERSGHFMKFKERAFRMSEREFIQVYEDTVDLHLPRATDLNPQCIDRILSSILTEDVLEVGTGRGYLAGLMSSNYLVTACDIRIDGQLKDRYPGVRFVEANIERLPFGDSSFGTVICTHTLEHVQDIFRSISELRRVAKDRLIIVVPKQRPAKYTFDLHLHFFPYTFSILAYFPPGPEIIDRSVVELGGDIYYQEGYRT